MIMLDSKKIKKKQMMIAVGGFAVIIILMVFGMWLSDPNRSKPSPVETAREKSKEVKQDFTAMP